ncbi:MAG TPA: site-specific DNA-methyltransferase [Acidimicrobiia bacterium]|nr:site-specific DNA-methyltransferase [Acidimicrobiia bacterium]
MAQRRTIRAVSGQRKATATSNFGVSKRESHDSSDFYARFTQPILDDSVDIDPRKEIDDVFVGNSASMTQVADNSAALVVTSPPYFAGKAYEEALGSGDIPATYLEYLSMLRDVFAECHRTLEPGGRMAINVANLGRKPYRSLAADVIGILQDDLGMLLRGEVIWLKARGSAGSCAWGSFQRPANPVLRDLTERVIIASKGRFDRALNPKQRERRRLPCDASMYRDEFMEATTDVWEIPTESATRVGHPAPFPVDLPKRLIHLYTYYDDLVLDPFMGSGTTAIAALRTGRHFVGYDTDEAYVDNARARIRAERERIESASEPDLLPSFRLPAVPAPAPDDEDFQRRATREGKAAKDVARVLLEECGFTEVVADVKLPGGVEVNFSAQDAGGNPWFFDVSGGFTSNRPGLKRTDTLWKAIGKAAVIHQVKRHARLVLLTTDAPTPGSAGAQALDQVVGDKRPIRDVIEMLHVDDQRRLSGYAKTKRVAADR